MKYIDAEKLIAEIERRLNIVEPHKDTFESAAACRQELIWMKDFITSLQQEQPHESFCEENCNGYKDTGGKCFFGFNCSAKKAHEQPKVDLGEEIDNVIADYSFTKTIDSGGFKTTVLDYAKIARYFYELGLKARKEE